MMRRLSPWMQGDPSHSPTPILRRMFCVGLLLRLAYITLAHTYRIRLFDDHFQFGWEMGRVGRALATGHGFADAFLPHSGPTAWFPPLYPLLIGGVFSIAGVYTPLSAWLLFAINSVFSAATAPAVYEIGARSFNRRVALWSGWLWTFYPAAMQYATHWIWDMAITACLFSWTLVLALRARQIDAAAAHVPSTSFARDGGSAPRPKPSPSHPLKIWATFGLLWGLIALLNASLLTFLPICLLWMAWPEIKLLHTPNSRTPGPRILHTLRNAALATLITAACIAPWIARNYAVFHALIPIRANLGTEIYMSSLESNNGFPWGTTISLFEAAPDMQRYKAIGEIAFSRERGNLGRANLRNHPGRLRRYTLKRLWFFWAGVPHPFEYPTPTPSAAPTPSPHPAPPSPVRPRPSSVFIELAREINFGFLSLAGLLGLALALRRHRPAAALYAAAFLFLPLAYYLVTVQARFRAPLEPLICVLAVYLFQSADRSRAFSLLNPSPHP